MVQVVEDDHTGQVCGVDVTLVGDLRQEVTQVFAGLRVDVVRCDGAGRNVLATPEEE